MAVALDSRNWLHHLRLSMVSWGDLRLQAAHQTLALCPGLALGHWQAATVFVARQAFGPAIVELRAGCASQDAQSSDPGRFRAVGLHLLHGLVLAATGADEAAFEELTRELDDCDKGHIYGRETEANTWYACGALHWRHGRCDDARAAFQNVLACVPGHASAVAALSLIDPPAAPPASSADPVEAAIATAIGLAGKGRHDEAARHCGDALAAAPLASAGWRLPVEPLLHPTTHAAAWASTLARLRERAS